MRLRDAPAMDQLFIKVLPLALASAVSPASLAVSLVLLGGKNHPRLKALAYLLGGAAVAMGITFLGLLLADGATQAAGPQRTFDHRRRVGVAATGARNCRIGVQTGQEW